jgi:hypothetical protein
MYRAIATSNVDRTLEDLALRSSYRPLITTARVSTLFAVVAIPAVAFAQTTPQDVECNKTETQAECHDRLKCKADEELVDCQKRLLKCKATETVEDCVRRVGAQTSRTGNRTQKDDASRRDTREPGNTNRDRRNDGDDRGDSADHSDRGDRRRDRERDAGSRPRRQQRGGHGFVANKTFGLGLELGEPSGLNGKYFLSPSGALDFGVGYIYQYYYYGDGLHIYADYLWHPTSLASAQAFELPFYIGGGLRLWDFNYCYLGNCGYSSSAIGIRVPIGIAFDFNRVPLDFFIQLVPVVDFITGTYYDQYRDRTHLGIDFSVGIRYWFK